MPTSSLYDDFTEVNLCVSDESPTLSGKIWKVLQSYFIPCTISGAQSKNVCYAKKF